MTAITLQDLERYATKRAVQATLRRVKISEEGTYEEFVGQLYDDIDQLIYRMQSGRELRQTDSEDRLSADVLGGLSILGYDAVADGKTGGVVLTLERRQCIPLDLGPLDAPSLKTAPFRASCALAMITSPWS